MSSTPHRFNQASFFQVQSPLLEYRKNIASQCGEDGIIERIFQIIRPENQYCVEFGAWDGKYLSNCWNLVANKGWSGLFIEGNKEKFGDLLATHGANSDVTCVNSFVDFEGKNSLDGILASAGAPEEIDIVSIDVDGTDYFIWESLNQFKPRLVVIEFNPTVPNDVIFVQAKDNSINQGCSLLSLIALGREKGYELVCCTEWNAFFVRSEFYAKFEIPSNFIHHMYQPPWDGRIFQGYDSQVYVLGMTKLVWANIELSSEDFQVLPRSVRRFGDSQRR